MEDIDRSSDLFHRIVPAVRHKTGKIFTGTRGTNHSEITYRARDHIRNPSDWDFEAGFYDHHEKKFYKRQAGDPNDLGIDAPDLMNKVQRMRTYGTEARRKTSTRPRELSTKGSTLMANMTRKQQANFNQFANQDAIRAKETPEQRKARMKALGYDVE
jgi:hypothetical protein